MAEGATTTTTPAAQEPPPSEGRTEMLSRHQKEIKELRSKEMEQKKAAAKGSKAEQKAKKKAIEEEITRLDTEMKQRHSQELASLGFASADNTNAARLDGLVRAIAGGSTAAVPAAAPKPSKGKKWRDKRAQQDAQREQRIQQEQSELVSSRLVEEEELMKALQPLGLSLREIKPDGHCLYRAVEDQLGGTDSVQQLRGLAAGYIRSHAEFFEPFLGGEREIGEYCEEIETTAAWGGEMELQALSHALKKHIVVFSAGQADVEMGTEYEDKSGLSTIRLSYHKHAFGLGEHYNSVIHVEPTGS